MTGHERGCLGQYNNKCTCGFEDQRAALLKALARLFKNLWNAGHDVPIHPYDWAVHFGLLEEFSDPTGNGYSVTELGKHAIAAAEEPGDE